MSVLDLLKRWAFKDAVHYTFAEIPDARVSPALPSSPIVAEENYFRIWLAEMFLRDDRRLFRQYVPVVHSAVKLTYGMTSQELPYVAGPHDLNLSSNLGQGVQLDHRLTNLLPFRGNAVDVTTALVAYKEKDFLEGFLEVVHDVSGLLNAGQLAASIKVVETAVDGIERLLGAGDRDVHLVYFQSFAGSTPTGGRTLMSGYRAIIRADEAKFDKTKLFVQDSRLYYGDSAATARPLQGYDYMLLRIESADKRDDFFSFEEFGKLLNTAIREGVKDRAKGDAVISTADVLVWDSTDLTKADRYRVAKALRDEYLKVVGPAAPPPGPPKPLREVQSDLVRAIDGVNPDEVKRAMALLAEDRAPTLEQFRAVLESPIRNRAELVAQN
jgi:hypothetical protein